MGFRLSFGIGPLRYSKSLAGHRKRKRKPAPRGPGGIVMTAGDLDKLKATLWAENRALLSHWQAWPRAAQLRYLRDRGIPYRIGPRR